MHIGRFTKILRRSLRAVLILILLAIAGMVIWNVVAMHDFYRAGEPGFRMPGIDNRYFDEQGIDYDENTDMFFLTGYMRDGTANPVYLVDAKTGETVKTVRLLNRDGSDFCGHAGGIAVTERFVYIAGSSDCCLYVFDKATVMQAENGERVACTGIFPTAVSSEDGVKVSFVTKTDDMICVGEFHLPLISAYKLRDNHRLNTQNGNNSSLMVGFRYDQEAPLGLSAVPCIAYSLPDRVQGVCFSGENIILSKSFPPIPSVLSYTQAVPEGSFTVMNTEVPLYSLRENSREYGPPMSEEVCVYNGRLYIASEFYNFLPEDFIHTWRAEYCWTLDVNDVNGDANY